MCHKNFICLFPHDDIHVWFVQSLGSFFCGKNRKIKQLYNLGDETKDFRSNKFIILIVSVTY